MLSKKTLLSLSISAALLSGCVTMHDPVNVVEPDQSISSQKQAQQAAQIAQKPTLKRKIALGRVTNETQYGRSLLRDDHGDTLGKQVTDMLSKALTQSEHFIVLERPDLGRLVQENNFSGSSLNRVGADVLLVGSLTEFGRKTDGKSGFAAKIKRQVATAKMDIRLIDTSNGRVIFAGSGAGEAMNESGNYLGWGSRSTYDGTLNDKAIQHAVSEVVNSLVTELANQPWKTYFLSTKPGQMAISGGRLQGLRVGDTFVVKTKGQRVKSEQTQFYVTLPGKEVAKIKVVELFGTNEVDEGALVKVVSGTISGHSAKNLVIYAE